MLGTAPITWGVCEMDGWGARLPYPRVLDEMRALGSAGTDPDAIGLCLDTGHIAYGGGDPVAIARRHAARIEHVHAKDVDPAILARVRSAGLGDLDAASAGIFVPAGRGVAGYGRGPSSAVHRGRGPTAPASWSSARSGGCSAGGAATIDGKSS